MNVLIPWDELSDVRKHYFADEESYHSFMSGYTTPIRTAKDIRDDDDVEEIQDAVIAWWKVDGTSIDVVIDAVLKIATRPPSDPVAEMDKMVRNIMLIEEWGDIKAAWQKVKELLP